ncbi:MAG: ABC transporter substrate-binding protein, partial [Halodesulfurarchaeum sp.]
GEETPTATPTQTETPSGTPTGPSGQLNLINSTIDTLDPIAAADTASGQVIQQLFDPLTNYHNGTTIVKNLLAESYEVSEDFTTYTFKIHPDAVYHNGDDVTASDLVYSWERLAASPNSRRARFILSVLGIPHETDSKGNYVPKSLKMSAPDENTFQFQLDGAFHATLSVLAYSSFAAVPEGIVGDIEGYNGEMDYQTFASENPIGCGPFQFDMWEAGTEAAVTSFPDYYRDKANVGRIHWQVIEKDPPHFEYAMNRNADIFTIPTTYYDPDKVSVEKTDQRGRQLGTYGPARNGATLNYVGVPTIDTFYIGFNMANVPAPVREAMAWVVNQKQFVNQVFKGRGKAAFHFTPPSIYPGGADAYTQHAKNKYPYGYNTTNIDKAIQVMEEAGYGPDNRFTLGWLQYQSDTWLSMAQIIRDRLASAYIDMEIQEATFATLLKRTRNGNMDAYTLGWIADWPRPDNFLNLLYPPATDTQDPAPQSYINWDNLDTKWKRQATQAWKTVEQNYEPTKEARQARQKAYVKIEEANWHDIGFLNLYHSLSERFWYDRVNNYTPFGGMGFSRQKLTSLSVE